MFKTLEELIAVIRQRKISSAEGSYTKKLLNDKKLRKTNGKYLLMEEENPQELML